MVTDRPDQTESTATVPPGALQFEIGVARTEGVSGDPETRVDQTFSTLVRIGLAENWEMRLGWDGWIDTSGADGAADTALGVKWRLGRSTGGNTSAALLVSTSVPTGESELTSERWDPELRLAVAHEVSERLAIGWNVGVARESALDANRRARSASFLLASATLALAAGDRLGVFLELFGEGGGSRGGPPETSFDGGVTILVLPNLQLDLAVGYGLSSTAADRFVGMGVSFRLPG